MIIVCGLPGTGKSTVSKMLVEQVEIRTSGTSKKTNQSDTTTRDESDTYGDGAVWIRMDQVRKDLAAATVNSISSSSTSFSSAHPLGSPPPSTTSVSSSSSSSPSPPPLSGQSIYSPEFTMKTYSHALQLTRQHLLLGSTVIVDATFTDSATWIQAFYDMMTIELGLNIASPSFHVVETVITDGGVIKQRLEDRRRVDTVSDADWSVYEKMEVKKRDQEEWKIGFVERHAEYPIWTNIDTSTSLSETHSQMTDFIDALI